MAVTSRCSTLIRGAKPAIDAGLQPGELIVVSGTYALKSRLLKSKIGDEH